VTITNNANALDLVTPAGFTVGQGTTKYVRVDVVGGAFGAIPALTTAGDATTAPSDFSASISQGGTAGDSFVVFEITDPTEDILVTDVLTIAAASYIVTTPGSTLTLQYAMYETGAGAVNKLENDLLYSDEEAAITFDTALAGEFSTGKTITATVASGFTSYKDGDSGATDNNVDQVGLLAEINTASLIKANTSFVKTDGSAFVANDLLSDSDTATATTFTQDVTFVGDFSFGDWALTSGTTCGANSTSLAVAADKASATAADVDLASAQTYVLCNTLTVDEDVAQKGSYTVELELDSYSDGAGTVVYDTVSIEVPYISTFADYNQRVYIINNGSSDAFYTMSFTSEDGVTATPKAAATGTAKAGEVLMLKTTDIVELTGKTRTSAVIEIEAVDSAVSAATQTVNLSDGSTDTTVLN